MNTFLSETPSAALVLVKSGKRNPRAPLQPRLTRLLSVHLNGNSQTGLLVGSQGKVIG